ncbi:MAG: hypothetical protein KHF84_00005, partial [Thermoplasmata archaeon]|nr:hypothetical protein [Candidatus Sysuiplasma jiujiangense]
VDEAACNAGFSCFPYIYSFDPSTSVTIVFGDTVINLHNGVVDIDSADAKVRRYIFDKGISDLSGNGLREWCLTSILHIHFKFL